MKATFKVGGEIDFLSPKEFNEGLAAAARSWRSELARGGQFKRIMLIGDTDGAGVLLMGGDSDAQNTGPEQGFMWSVRRLYVYGLADGDQLECFINSSQRADAVAPFTFLAPYKGFHPSELVLKPSDRLVFAGTGLPVSTRIVVTGSMKEVPEFMAWSL